MREGWKCSVCGKGISPDKKTCSHGAVAQWPIITIPLYPDPLAGPTPSPTSPSGGCPACAVSGVCMCYRPERGGIRMVLSDAPSYTTGGTDVQ